MTIIAYTYRSRIGTFFIQKHAGRWMIMFDNENLGAGYVSPHAALDDLSGGHCDWPGVIDPSTLGISDDLGDWEPIPGK